MSSDGCHACGATNKPLMKLSLGKDFFGRPYDRLSPSADQNPRWYCEVCSLHKNLQRAQTRLREIAALLDGREGGSPLINVGEVTSLLHRLQHQPAALTT